MAKINSRAKGRTGQSIVKALLLERDWIVADLSCGIMSEDILAIDPNGVTWSVEVKKCKNMMYNHVQQAMRQAHDRKARWALFQHIAGTSSWLVRRQGEPATVWHERK